MQNQRFNLTTTIPKSIERKMCPYSVFFDPHFFAFGLNTDIYSVNLGI